MSRIERSSGNVFADLGLPNPDRLLARAAKDIEAFKSLAPYESATDMGVTTGFMQRGQSVAVCNLTRMPEYWWVARVFVRSKYRRQHLGSRCLERAIELAERQGGPDRIVVAPGGYSTPYDQQCAFYAAHGFVGSGLMERPV